MNINQNHIYYKNIQDIHAFFLPKAYEYGKNTKKDFSFVAVLYGILPLLFPQKNILKASESD